MQKKKKKKCIRPMNLFILENGHDVFSYMVL